MKIVLLGAPGCGKGTQGHRLAERYRIPEISTGDLLRDAVAAGTELGKAAKAVMDAGQLVSDDIVLGVIRERLKLPDARNGFILDGFPRNAAQAEQLDELLDQLGQPIDLALLIEVDVDIILQRLLGRRTCVSCGASYNIFYAPPRMDDSCDDCGGRLKRRGDDNEETIGNRLRIYETQTLPVVERYRDQERLRVIQGVGDIDDVFKAVSKSIEEVRATLGSRDRSVAIRRAVARKQQTQGEREHREEPAGAAGAKAAAVKKTGASGKTASGSKAVKKSAAKTARKKAVVRKKPVQKPAAGKKPVRKKVVKKSAAKKAVTGKATTRKAASRKAVTKKSVTKKSVTKKTVTRKAASKKAVSGKAASKKVVARKVATKKKRLVKKTPVKKKAGSGKQPTAGKKGSKKPQANKNATRNKAARKKVGRKR